jgi:hypothetical protein
LGAISANAAKSSKSRSITGLAGLKIRAGETKAAFSTSSPALRGAFLLAFNVRRDWSTTRPLRSGIKIQPFILSIQKGVLISARNCALVISIGYEPFQKAPVDAATDGPAVTKSPHVSENR